MCVTDLIRLPLTRLMSSWQLGGGQILIRYKYADE